MSRLPESHSVHGQVVTPKMHELPSQRFTNNYALPFDVLCEILTHAGQMSWRDSLPWGSLPLESIDKSLSRVELMVVPIRLAQVCRYWRDVAMACPSVWANIDVLFGGKDDKKRAEWFIKAVDDSIERSKAAPLSVSISCGCDNITEDIEPNRDAVERILKKLLDHQHRWRQAYFTFSRWGTSRPPKIELLDVPILETFSIYWMSGALSHARQVYIDTSRSAKLRSLHIGGRPHIESRDGNLSSVTEVTCLDNPIYRRRRVPLLEVIQQAPNLESLKFFCDSSERDGNLQYPLTSLCKLRTLEVDNSINSAFMISKLILPILSHLICHWANSGCRVKKLPDIFRTPLPSVEYLDLVELSEVDDRLTPFIRLLPNLKSLRMIGIGITPSFFDVLSVNETPINYFQPRKVSSILCPSLAELYLENHRYIWSEGEVAVNSLCNMLEVRCNALNLVGTIECGPVGAHETNQHFNFPFVDIGCKEMLETLKRASWLRIRFTERCQLEADLYSNIAKA